MQCDKSYCAYIGNMSYILEVLKIAPKLAKNPYNYFNNKEKWISTDEMCFRFRGYNY